MRRLSAMLAKSWPLIIMAALTWALIWHRYHVLPADDAAMLLLIPDGGDRLPSAAVWIDAAREEGVPLQAITTSEFLQLDGGSDAKRTIILPDGAMRSSTEAILARVRSLSSRGGTLMIVNDALTEIQDAPATPNAPLADLVGVNYGGSQQRTIPLQPVMTTPAILQALRIPPGKLLPLAAPKADQLLGGETQAIAGYLYGVLSYPVMATEGAFTGAVLMSDPRGDLVARLRPAAEGRGKVLFVNLPLGYLKGHTDGLLLHAFLHSLAFDTLGLPVLSQAPDDIGRMIFNWHVDSNAATVVLENLARYQLADDGPFSIDVTAGPDLEVPGDRRGMDLPHNLAMQHTLRMLSQRGDSIGSHGGWIHNYFGHNVGNEPAAEMRGYLERNAKAIEEATGKPPIEYSAPLGNEPEWVTDWLESHGFVGYYFTGNNDMAPTRSYRNGVLRNRTIWSFPILVDGSIASFEEAGDIDMSAEDLEGWLDRIVDFVAAEGTMRTFYSHPHSFPKYRDALGAWLGHVKALKAAHKFAWITMPEAAAFMDAREKTHWRVTREADRLRLTADNPDDLSHQAWRWPAAAGVPRVRDGSASVTAIATGWRIVATGGHHLVIEGAAP